MNRLPVKLVLAVFVLVTVLAGLTVQPAVAQENTICGLLQGGFWGYALDISPTNAIVIRPMDVDDMLAMNNLTLETYVRIYDPVFISGEMNGVTNVVIEGFSRVETVPSCFETLPTSTPLPTRTPTPIPTQKPVTTSYGCTSSAEKAPQCGCGVYAALQTFGGTITSKLGRSYPSAASLANQVYWNEGYLQYPQTGIWRYRNDVARADDALIMQANADYWVYQSNGKLGANVQKAIPFGHAGIIRSANYTTKTIDKQQFSGWDITLRSANWGCYTGNKTFQDGTCANVSDVKIFVPNGSAISFWRKVSSPEFTTLYSTAGQKMLQPVKSEAGSQVQGGAEYRPQVSQQYSNPAYTKQTLQDWALVKLPETDPYLKTNYYQIVNLNSGLCLDISGGASNNGASVILWGCHNGDNQKWLLIPQYGSYQIQSKSSGKLLTFVAQQSPALMIWEQKNTNDQLWTLKRFVPAK